MGTLPVAYTRSSKGSVPSAPLSRSRQLTDRRSRSMPTTSVRSRTSMPAARCWSGVRAISDSSFSTAPLIQYGMPHAE
jgi:hypothetical protein